MQSFSNIRALIIDMDGVLWHGDQALPGLIDFFQTLRELNLRFVLATNNASQTAQQYVGKLAKMGVAVELDEIMTSGMATAMYLTERVDPSSTRVFVIGEDGTRVPLLERGFILSGLYEVNDPSAGHSVVICGLDRAISWDKLATATLNIRAGATFIGTNPDTSLPTERGVILGNGAIVSALQAASGVQPTFIGKPEPIMYRQALALLGTSPSETIAIGDRLGTDILGAVRADMRSLLVLTGISTEAELHAIDYQPTWVMRDIVAVTQALRKLTG